MTKQDALRSARRCAVCGGPMQQPLAWLYRCPACGFLQSTLSPGAGRGIEGLETLRRQNFRTVIAALGALRPLQGLAGLEVGCAEGWFLEEMRGSGTRMRAIEPSAQALELQRRGVDVIQGFFPEALPAEARFDLIVFNDVFEHIPDPVAAIAACERHLLDGGLLVLNLPNARGFFYRVATLLARLGMASTLERMWQKGFASPHMTYFSNDNIERFVHDNTGLRHVRRFYLPSVAEEGLEERIGASHGKVASRLMGLGIRLLMPAIRRMPQDIMVFVFQKSPSGPATAVPAR